MKGKWIAKWLADVEQLYAGNSISWSINWCGDSTWISWWDLQQLLHYDELPGLLAELDFVARLNKLALSLIQLQLQKGFCNLKAMPVLAWKPCAVLWSHFACFHKLRAPLLHSNIVWDILSCFPSPLICLSSPASPSKSISIHPSALNPLI